MDIADSGFVFLLHTTAAVALLFELFMEMGESTVEVDDEDDGNDGGMNGGTPAGGCGKNGWLEGKNDEALDGDAEGGTEAGSDGVDVATSRESLTASVGCECCF